MAQLRGESKPRKDGRRSQGMASEEKTQRLLKNIDAIVSMASAMRMRMARDEVARAVNAKHKYRYRMSASCLWEVEKDFFDVLLPLVKAMRDALDNRKA